MREINQFKHAQVVCKPLYICRKPSAKRLFPSSQALSRPCSDRSILFKFGASA